MSDFFNDLVTTDTRSGALFESAIGVMINHMADAHGITVTADELRVNNELLPALRLAVLTDDALSVETCSAEILRRLPGIAEKQRAVQLKEALARHEQSAVDSVYTMPRAQRLEAARSLDAATKAAQTAKVMTAEEEASGLMIIRSIKDAATRLSVARQLGLA